MWCRHCQQQTPALGPAGASGPRCARCQRSSPAVPTPASVSAGVVDDGDETRRAIYRSLRSAHATIAAGEAARTFRLDVAQTPLVEAFARPSRRAKPGPLKALPLRNHPATFRAGRGQTLAWLLAAFGAGFTGLGVGLGAWSMIGDQTELWNPALAATLGGQALLVFGLLQLLTSLWNAARHATVKLAEMHDELRRVRRATEEAAGRSEPTAAAFFANASREASPEMLLGSLRGQLDRLASRLR